jgi:hypoxanthine phosphoribosyltransferase
MSLPMKLLLSESEIHEAVRKVAGELTRDLSRQRPVLVCILKGAFLFFADLVRELDFPFDVEFVRAASYGSGTQTSGSVQLLLPPQLPVEGRHVVLVEDLVDSGYTLQALKRSIEAMKPASVRIATLLDKEGRREVDVPVDYIGIRRECGFVVGYGTDCAERYRGLPAMFELEAHDLGG